MQDVELASQPLGEAAPESRRARRSQLLALGGLTALAALLRFSTLDVQSFWYDEILTTSLVRLDLGKFLSAYPHSELGPPLYFTSGWVWEKIFGPGEVGLRSLSALFGTATVPVAYAAARELVSRRAGLVVAALVASSPLLIWYSQEARPYALLVFLVALSFLFFVRALNDGHGRALAWWALASALAVGTHYFAVFLVAPEAVGLLLVGRERRQVLAAIGAVATVGVALVPIALTQRATGRLAASAGGNPLADRIKDLPKHYLTGLHPTAKPLALASVLVVLALALVVTRTGPRERRAALVALSVATAAVATPLVLAILGADVFTTRYLLPAWLPFATLVGVGLSARRAQPVGMLATVALCGVFLFISVRVATDVTMQRDDWRGAARALGPVNGSRAIVVSPGSEGDMGVEVYRGRAHPMPPEGARVREIVILDVWGRNYQAARPPTVRPPVKGFEQVERRDTETFSILRFRSPEPVDVNPDDLAVRSSPLLDHPGLQELPLLRPRRVRQGPRYFDNPKSRPSHNNVRFSVLVE